MNRPPLRSPRPQYGCAVCVGGGGQVRCLFGMARHYAPATLFFDEIDGEALSLSLSLSRSRSLARSLAFSLALSLSLSLSLYIYIYLLFRMFVAYVWQMSEREGERERGRGRGALGRAALIAGGGGGARGVAAAQERVPLPGHVPGTCHARASLTVRVITDCGGSSLNVRVKGDAGRLS